MRLFLTVMTVRSATVLIVLLASVSARAGDAVPDFAKEIRPLLEVSCVKCHGAKKQKGGIDFSVFSDRASILRHRKMWRKAATQIEASEMPPEEEKQLTKEQRELILRWIKGSATRVDCADAAERSPGRSILHRLTLDEYNLTIRDLLGVEFNAANAVGMPEDSAVQGFSNQASALTMPPVLLEKYFAAADKVVDLLFSVQGKKLPPKADGATQKRHQTFEAFLSTRPAAGVTDRDAANKILERLVRRAYRRPAQKAELERLIGFYDRAAAKGEAFENAVRQMLKPVLVSPHFLYRVERDQAKPGSQEAYKINAHELAVRLSYFLWSSMPDEELFKLAEQGKLSDPAVQEAQVKRMLADPKARALTEHFAEQWLQIGKVEVARPSTEFFPTFNQQMRTAMHDETAMFFDNLRTEDRSILELLDADYTFLNQDLAKHYNIAGVSGPKMQRVKLKPEDHRGGLMGMGSMLALTSHTSRTSPTLRGKWMLEVIFGDPPPPPPPDAGMLKEEKDKKKEPKTFREQMALHAADATCAACHKKIDPLGYALENFDAVGRWRDDNGGRPLDNSGELPGGDKFTGPAELKKVVLKRQDEFVHNMIEQMMAYALRRELQYYDDCPIQDVTLALQKNQYRFSALVLAVVSSYPFQYRRNADSFPDEDAGAKRATLEGAQP